VIPIVLATAVTVSGMATIYEHYGHPLYCGGTFDLATPTWVALDVSEYQSGRVRCGDPVRVKFANGQTLRARALDAGYLYKHHIADTGLPIVVDVPVHLAPFAGLSIQAELHLVARHPHLTR
jgi:hypothetical protein